jgi:transcriptional regulator with XRE-family HTH domain
MTPEQFRKIRNKLGLSANKMGVALGLRGDPGRTVRRYESGDIEISGPVQTAALALAEGFRPPWFPHDKD